jgi:hypothetical protein
MVENCLKWPKTSKLEFAQTRTRAEGLEMFQMGYYLSEDVFERKTASQNNVVVKSWWVWVKNSKLME